MHVKLPPPAFPTTQAETAPTKQRLAREIAAAVTEDLQEVESAAPAADHADIRPLDVSGGLRVMLAEVRSAFDLIAESMGTDDPDPAQAARQIVEWVLHAMPEDASDTRVWSSALLQVEAALQAGLQQTENVLSNWPDVPTSVIDAVKQSGSLVHQVLGDDGPNPLWLRPEWLGLEPRLERFRRRRRVARRHLIDPDLSQGGLDDKDEQIP